MKKVRKIVVKLCIAIIIILLMSLCTVIGFAKWQREPNNVEAGIILGAAINTPALYNRSIHGLKLLETGKVQILVLSGGRISDRDISEAGYMKKVILKNNNNKEESLKLILEESSRNTFENIRNSKEKIANKKSVVVISDEYHLARASLLAWRMGFKQVYWSAPESSFYPKKELYFHYFREVVALVVYIPKFIFN
jgi:uncharacterized SAM-binding protein YcdF (DUF218 family)